jgi:membrane-associated phospholipid phosphatase
MNNSSDVVLPSAQNILVTPRALAIPFLTLIAFLAVWLTNSNQQVFLWLNHLGMGHVSKLFWANMTILGDTLVTVPLISLFMRQRPEIVWVILIAAVFATLWVHGLKLIVNQPRPGAVLLPDVIHIIGVKLLRSSFPSGHATTAFTLAGVLCLLRMHPAYSCTALLLALVVGLSRSVVGAHWPLDTLAGAFGGWVSAAIGVGLYRQLAHVKQWGTHVPGQKIQNMGLLLISLTLLFYQNGYPTTLIFQYAIAVICIIVIAFNLHYLYRQPQPVS